MLNIQISPEELTKLILCIEDIDFVESDEVLWNLFERLLELTKTKEYLNHLIQEIIKNKLYVNLDGKTFEEAVNHWSPNKDYVGRNEYIIRQLVESNHLSPDSNWILRAND